MIKKLLYNYSAGLPCRRILIGAKTTLGWEKLAPLGRYSGRVKFGGARQ